MASLTRLLSERGEVDRAQRLLSQSHGTFSRGFNMMHLIHARQHLSQWVRTCRRAGRD